MTSRGPSIPTPRPRASPEGCWARSPTCRPSKRGATPSTSGRTSSRSDPSSTRWCRAGGPSPEAPKRTPWPPSSSRSRSRSRGSLPACPAPLRWVVERCLAKAPADRYAATRDLARELGNLKERLSEISTVPESAPRAPEIPMARRRRGGRVAPRRSGGAALDPRALHAFRSRSGLPAPHAAAGCGVPRPVRPQLERDPLHRLVGRRAGPFVPDPARFEKRRSKPRRRHAAADGVRGGRLGGARAARPVPARDQRVRPPRLLARAGGRPRVVMEEAGWSDLARRARFLAVVQPARPRRCGCT